MTAEEVFDKIMSEYDVSRTYTVDWVTEAMKEYAEIKCKEQRALCHFGWANCDSGTQDEAKAIYEAPKPNFD